MKHVVCYVIGEPGVGKTSLVREFVCDSVTKLVPKPKWTYSVSVCAAGHYTGEPFDGGDTVPYSGARECLEYWKTNILPSMWTTFLDGDRFSTKPSLEFLREVVREVPDIAILGIHLVSPFAAERRVARGTIQNPTWVKGRITKANNFAKEIGAIPVSARMVQSLITNMARGERL